MKTYIGQLASSLNELKAQRSPSKMGKKERGEIISENFKEKNKVDINKQALSQALAMKS